MSPEWGSQSTTNTSTYTFTPSGSLLSVSIADGRPRTVTFKNDLEGRVIRRDESDNIGTQGDPHGVWYRFGGREIATTNNVFDDRDLSYDKSINRRTEALPSANYTFNGGGIHDHDLSYERINSFTQGSARGQYVVRGGETLQSIAQAVWGDASYWYKIAEANGLSGDAMLVEGQSHPNQGQATMAAPTGKGAAVT